MFDHYTTLPDERVRDVGVDINSKMEGKPKVARGYQGRFMIRVSGMSQVLPSSGYMPAVADSNKGTIIKGL